MILCSSIIIPSIGIVNLAICLIGVKAAVLLWQRNR
jgi:hypothetical protein